MTLGMLGRWTAVAAGGALAALAAPGGAAAQVGLEPVGTYDDPAHVTSDPDDPDRLFISERAGVIRLTTPEGTSEFADLTSVVLANGQEQGLLSIAFPADHAETGLLYVAYTTQPNGALQVAELEADGDAADPDSLRPVLAVPSPFANHNAGQLQFGPDGYLYVSTGDGGSGGDPQGNGQDLTTFLGSILRIDPRQSGTQPYTVPETNPYVDPEERPVPGARPEIWSWGLRNPWRFSFDRETGALTIGDVGQGQREEIDYRPQEVGGGRGDNFGWNCREGLIPYGSPSSACATTGPDYADPVFDYPHAGTSNCSITGGYVVRDPSLPELYGRYLYADYCVGQLRSIELALPQATGDRSEGLSVGLPSSFGEDACGRVYVASRSNGVVSRLVGDAEPDCDPDPPVDEVPPVTTLRIDGEPPEIEYDRPVEVTLSATDLPEGEDASGVAHVDYRLSDNFIEGKWVQVTNDGGDEPFEVSFTVSPLTEEMAHARRRSPVVFFYTLDYRASDVAGNVEEERSVDFAIIIGEPEPRLQLTVNRRRLVVGPRARRTIVRARLANVGDDASGSVRLCAKAPKRRLAVRGPRCTTHPALAPGQVRRAKVRLRVKRRARGKLTRVRLIASERSVGSMRTVVRVRARR